MDIHDLLTDPDFVGVSAYRAVFDAVNEALLSAEADADFRAVAIAEAEAVKEEAESVLRILRGED